MGIIQKQAIQNTVITYTGTLIAFANLIFIQPYFLTTEELGLTRILFSFASLVSTFVPLGITSITTKYFPVFRDREQKHRGFFGFMLLYGLAGYLLVALILWLCRDFLAGQYAEKSKLFADYFNYVFPLSLFLGFFSILQTYAFALFRPGVPALLNEVLSRIVTIVVTGLYFLRVLNLDEYIFLFTAVYGLQTLVLFFFILRIDRISLRPDREFFSQQGTSKIMTYGLLMAFASLSSLGLKFLDAIMLGREVPLSEVGIYTIAAFIPTVIEIPLAALEKILNPRMAHSMVHGEREKLREMYYRSAKYMLLIGGLLFLLVDINVNDLLQLVPRDGYVRGEHVVLIISIGTLINMATGANNTLIFSADAYYKYGILLLAGLFVMAFLGNLLLIPRYGMEGAALATVISSTLYNLAKFFFIRKAYGLQPFDTETLRILLMIAATGSAVYFIPSIGGPIVAIAYKSVFVVGLYLCLALALRVTPELKSGAVNFLRRKRS